MIRRSLGRALRVPVLFTALLAIACGVARDHHEDAKSKSALRGFAWCNDGELSQVRAFVACVGNVGGRSVTVFGYENTGTQVVLQPEGAENQVLGGDPWNGLGSTRPPTSFPPGRNAAAFAVTGSATWRLGAEDVRPTGATPTCSTRTVAGETLLSAGDGEDLAVDWDPQAAFVGAIVPTQAPLSGRAIGATPAAFEVTDRGAATVTIPIAVPAGRNGMQPSIALRYDSDSGNGPVGVGWQLQATSQIARCPKTLRTDGETKPVEFSSDDRLCLDGQVLVPMDASKTEFRPLGSPYTRVRIVGTDSLGPTAFTVAAPDGRISSYGAGNRFARVEGFRSVARGWLATDPSARASAGAAGLVDDTASFTTGRLGWLLDSVRDRFGNEIRYAYEVKTSANGAECVQEDCILAHDFRIAEISYTHHPSAPATRTVRFEYEDRSDTDVAFVAGFGAWRSGRLSRVKVFGPMPKTVALVREYRLGYRASAMSGESLLANLTECDGAGVCRPARTFEYEPGSDEYARVETWDGRRPDLLPRTPLVPSGRNWTNPNLVVADFDGDGRDDVFYRADDGRWRLRLGSLSSDIEPTSVAFENAPRENLGLPVYQEPGKPTPDVGTPAPAPVAIDVDSDGQAELAWPEAIEVVKNHATGEKKTQITWATYRLRDVGARPSGGREYQFTKSGLGNCTVDAEIGVAPIWFDADGDGRLECVAPQPNGWYVAGGWVDGRSSLYTTSLDGARNWVVAAPDADLAGNRPVIGAEAIAPIRSSGGGFTAISRPIPLADRRFHGVMFADLNGDGLADVVQQRFEKDDFRIFLNTGAGFKAIAGTSPLLQSWSAQENQGLAGFLPSMHRQGSREDLILAMRHRPGDGDPLANALQIEFGGSPLRLRSRITPVASMPRAQFFGADPRRMGQIRTLDVNGDGLDDLLLPYQAAEDRPLGLAVYVRRGRKANVLTAFDNGLGDRTEIRYRALQSGPRDCTYPIRCATRGLWLVSEWSEHVTAGTGYAQRDFQASYEEPAFDLRGAGFLGFASRTVRALQTKTVSTTHYGRSTEEVRGFFPFAGVATRSETRTALEKGFVENVVTTEVDLAVVEGPKRPITNTAATIENVAFTTRPRQIVERAVEEREGTRTTLRETRTQFEKYDEFSNVEQVVTTTPGAGATTVVLRTYENDQARWLLGKVLGEEVRSTRTAPDPADPGSRDRRKHGTRVRAWRHDDATGVPVEEIVEPGAADVELRIRSTRDAFGLVTKTDLSDANDRHRITEFVHDAEGATVATIDPLGLISRQAVHPSLGVAVEARTPRGVVSRVEYDGFGQPRRMSTRAPRGCASCPNFDEAVTITHGADGARPTVRTERTSGGSSIEHFDPLGRVYFRRHFGPAGETVEILEYEPRFPTAVARRTLRSNSVEGLVWSNTYDALGRVLTSSAPGAGTTTHSYAGLLAVTRDALGTMRAVLHDELGRLAESYTFRGFPDGDPDGRHEGFEPVSPITTRYTYGAFDTLIGVTDALGNRIDRTYDRAGRVVAEKDPDTGLTETEYDAFGQLLLTRDALGRVIRHGYDGAGRLVATEMPEGGRCFAYGTGSRAADVEVASTKPMGGSSVVTRFAHDAFGRVTTHGQQIDGEPLLEIKTSYDRFGRIAERSYPNGVQTRNGYGPFGDLVTVSARAKGAAEFTVHWRKEQEDALGRLRRESFGDGSITTRSFHAGTTLVDERRSTIPTDPNGGFATRHIWHPNGKLASLAESDGRSQRYSYDGRGQLRTWRVNDGAGESLVLYDYDDLGSLVARHTTPVSGATTTETFLHGRSGAAASRGLPPHAVVQTAAGLYDYDLTGDQISAPGRSIAWTSFHQPHEIQTQPSPDVPYAFTSTYTYDALGRRVRKATEGPNGTTTYVPGADYEISDGYTKVGLRNGSGVFADLFVSTDGTATTIYHHRDHLGSPRRSAFKLGSFAGSEPYAFEPFGRRVRTDDSLATHVDQTGPFKRQFTGHEYEEESGLLNMGGRIYDPATAHFLSADPIVIDASLGHAYNAYS
jgi:RHS repeat-associated protein